MSGQTRDEALRRLECILLVVADELSDTTASLTEQDLGHFITEVAALARQAWDFRPDDTEEDEPFDAWEYWPTTG